MNAEELAEEMYPESDMTYGCGAVREAFEYGWQAALSRDAAPAIERVRALHRKREIYPLDKYGAADIDAEPIAYFCEACTSDSTVIAIEDAEWSEDCPTVYWPCPTIRALEPLPVGGESDGA